MAVDFYALFTVLSVLWIPVVCLCCCVYVSIRRCRLRPDTEDEDSAGEEVYSVQQTVAIEPSGIDNPDLPPSYDEVIEKPNDYKVLNASPPATPHSYTASPV